MKPKILKLNKVFLASDDLYANICLVTREAEEIAIEHIRSMKRIIVMGLIALVLGMLVAAAFVEDRITFAVIICSLCIGMIFGILYNVLPMVLNGMKKSNLHMVLGATALLRQAEHENGQNNYHNG